MGISAWGWHIWFACAKGSHLLHWSWQDVLVLFKTSHKSGAFSQLFPTEYPAPLTPPETVSKAKQFLKLYFFNLFCYKPTKQLIRGALSASSFHSLHLVRANWRPIKWIQGNSRASPIYQSCTTKLGVLSHAVYYCPPDHIIREAISQRLSALLGCLSSWHSCSSF